VLLLHEVHHIRGRAEDDFEDAYRRQWMPQVAEGDEGRLLWFLHHAHGSGPAYHMVTVTALRDASAWGRLVERVHDGDLRPWARQVDEFRHDVTAKLLVPVEWSPMASLDLGAVPVDGVEHELSIYMEDTGWPDAAVEDYVSFWQSSYFEPMRRRAATLLDIQSVARTAFGTGRRKEAVLMQKVVDHQALLRLLTTEVPPAFKEPGSFMYEALELRDRWESKLLRTSSWSPLY